VTIEGIKEAPITPLVALRIKERLEFVDSFFAIVM
jgi:hypothetical protein